MPVRPPAHCHYFHESVAVVPLFIKGPPAPAGAPSDEKDAAAAPRAAPAAPDSDATDALAAVPRPDATNLIDPNPAAHDLCPSPSAAGLPLASTKEPINGSPAVEGRGEKRGRQ